MCLWSHSTVTCLNSLTAFTECSVTSMLAFFFFFVLVWITAPDYYITIVYIWKKGVKNGNNTIIWKILFAMGRKLFWNFILKTFILWLFLICVYLFMYELLPLNIIFFVCVKKWAKCHIWFNKVQFIDQIAIQNVRQLLYISLHV